MKDKEQRPPEGIPLALYRARFRAAKASVKKRAEMPKCGARKRSNGEPCGQPVSEAGKRCRYHGGATPKGAEWHRRQWPRKGAPLEKLNKKIAQFKKRDREAAARRAAMSDEELAQHEERRKAKRPGAVAERERAARKRNTRGEIEKLLADRAAATAAADAKLDRQIADLLGSNDELPEVFK